MTSSKIALFLSFLLLTGCNLANPKPSPTPTPAPSALPTALPTFNTQPINTPVYRPPATYQPVVSAFPSPLPSVSPTPTPLVGTSAMPRTGSGLKEIVALDDTYSPQAMAEARFSQDDQNQIGVDLKIYKGFKWTGQTVDIREGSCAQPGKSVAILNSLTNGRSVSTIPMSADQLTQYPAVIITVRNGDAQLLCGAMNE